MIDVQCSFCKRIIVPINDAFVACPGCAYKLVESGRSASANIRSLDIDSLVKAFDAETHYDDYEGSVGIGRFVEWLRQRQASA